MSQRTDLFEENRQLWARFSARQALMLPYVDTGAWQLCRTTKDEVNLQKSGSTDSTESTALHSHSGAAQEATTWFNSLTLDGIGILYVYGIGLGYYYEAARDWLAQDSSRQLIFLEDDIAIIAFFLATQRAGDMLHNEQCHLYYFEHLDESEEILNTLFWSCFLTGLNVSALPYYAKHKAERFSSLKYKIEYDASQKNTSLEEYLSFGDAFFLNFYPNMRQIAGSLLGNKLFGKFQGVPAIICGAGPSLNKQLPKLAALKERALLFAGGSSINALTSHELLPHFGAAIDPNPMQLDRISRNKAFDVPIFYRNRLFHKAFQAIHGPRLYVTGSGGYDVAGWFERQLGIDESVELSEGYNVINFCIEIAAALGCNPIILVGMDLGYTDGHTYARGIVADTALPGQLPANLVLRKDIFGMPMYTEWKWIVEAQWIATFAKEHSRIQVINATEGGLGMEGVANIPFNDVITNHLVNQWDLLDLIPKELSTCAMPHVTDATVIAVMEKLHASLLRCIALFELLLKENSVILARIKTNPENSSQPTQTGRAALYESDLEEEEGYKAVIQIFNQIYNHVLERDLRRLHKRAVMLPWAEQESKKIELADTKYTFLCNVAKFNALIIEKVLKDETF